MQVRGMYQEIIDCLQSWLIPCFPETPIVWCSGPERSSLVKQSAFPFVDVQVDDGKFVSQPFGNAQYPQKVYGLGYFQVSVEISIIDQKKTNQIVASVSDKAITAMLLNLPHDKFTDYLLYNQNSIHIESLEWSEIERAETENDLTKYTVMVTINKFLGKREDLEQATIKDFELGIELKEDLGNGETT